MKESLRLFVKLLLIVLIYLMVFPADSSAGQVSMEELRSRIDKGWHQTYEAYGRTVTVDVDMQVPDADKAPVLRVTFPGPLDTDFLTQKGYRSVNRDEWFAGGIDEGPYGPEFNPGGRVKSPISELRVADLDWDRAYAEDNPMTLGEADKFMRDKLVLLFGDDAQMELNRIVLVGRLRRYNEKTREYGEPVRDMGGYKLRYLPVLHGIPILANAVNTFCTRVNQVPAERMAMVNDISATLYTPEAFNLCFVCKKEVDMPYEDIPLCSFETVKKAYEALIEKGQIRRIFNLRLGYVLYQDAKEKMIFWAVPSWVAECEWYDSPKGGPMGVDQEADLIYEISGYWQIIVNAQTGELLDPLDTSNDRSHCPKLISWKDIQ